MHLQQLAVQQPGQLGRLAAQHRERRRLARTERHV
eukprot:CAMPEP_0185451568 /NCGR_PEP_ID=MMETSP1365-20130426/65238_1 /TAXON_ID=38817 /ORGANISM="Gephyrocapsa oceanica, Strain RCC1303" /LENGTH=34 /DNA_ID= /DNA_START= /DNA_END= /DNA_ORIENTATION=